MYGKGQSHVIAKLRGTYIAPKDAAPAPVSTDLQKSIFSGPPGALPARPPANANAGEGQGLKRARDDESDDEGAPMEEDSDVPMEADSDED